MPLSPMLMPKGGIASGKASDGRTYGIAVDGENVYEIEWESDEGDILDGTWKSGYVITPRAVAYQTFRVRTADDPGDVGTLNVYARGDVLRAAVTLDERIEPGRLPCGWRTTEVQVEIISASVIESIGVWDSMAEAQ